jgi:MSHA pilin protein MshD
MNRAGPPAGIGDTPRRGEPVRDLRTAAAATTPGTVPRAQRGLTLIELVISIVIIGIAAAALYSAMAAISGRSADPLLRQQSLALAEAYLEEIELQAYAVTAPAAGCSPARSCYNDVRDYAGLNDSPPQDANGNLLTALSAYRVQVSVSAGTLSGRAALRIDVSVTDPSGQPLLLSGYRTCYGELAADGATSLCPSS